MDIERLRALEKDLREEERQQLAESRRHADEGNDETVQAFCNGKAFGLNSAAQRIATLIAELGQEVGAVAWTDDRGLERLREGKQEMVSGVRLGSDTTALYLSPAHTSEARDAAVMKLLDERIAAETNKTRRWALICFRDAAMRQEAGSRE